MAGLERAGEARRALGFYADHADLGVVELGERGDAAGKAAAAHGNQDGVDERQLLDDLHGDGALAGGDGLVVKGRDIGETLLLGELDGVRLSLVEHVAVQHDLGAVALGALDLDERGGGGHDHDGAGAGVCGGIGHALRVVACARSDHAAVELLLRELGNLVVGAAQLVGTRALHVLGLEPHAVAAAGRKARALHELGCLGDLFDLDGGLFERLEGEHICHVHFLRFHACPLYRFCL